MLTWTDALPFFPEHELACSCCGQIKLDISLASHLPALRLEWDKPLSPSSVCRCGPCNESEGGHPRSLHLMDNPVHPTNGSAAADIKWRHWSRDDKIAFARLAYSLGWSVGLHDGFCHIDRRIDAGLRQAVYDYGSGWSGAFDKSEVIN